MIRIYIDIFETFVNSFSTVYAFVNIKTITTRMALSVAHTSANGQHSPLITIKQLRGVKHTQCCRV